MSNMTVGIIGAGAAGMMAAATILEETSHVEVILFERNPGLGKKVIISGGGRCNVTTGLTEVREVLTRYPRGGAFLTSAMYAFPPLSVRAWFERRGVPLKEEVDRRVFPISDDGNDVVGAFDQLFKKHRDRIQIRLNTSVIRVEPPTSTTVGAPFTVILKGERTEVVDRLILTTGGQAYRSTGSTGDGYAFAQSCRHTITPLAPSLNSFFTQETWPHHLAGLSFEDATISLAEDKKTMARGPFLFTHKGVSGPAVFALSAKSAYQPLSKEKPLTIAIDLFPDTSQETLAGEFWKRVLEHPKQQPLSIIRGFVPASLAEVTVRALSLPEKPVCEMKKVEWLHVAGWLKRIIVSAIQRGAGDEFVTAGGVPTSEVDPRTMESCLCPGLFFAGEILDVDGVTGGFNLQASWATGRLAGLNVFRND